MRWPAADLSLALLAGAAWAADAPAWTQRAPGNVFTAAERPAVAIAADAAVPWRITGFRGEEIAAGTAVAAGGLAEIPIPARPGYYLVHATTPSGIRRTSAAVVPAPRRPSGEPVWGAATHCAQGMSTAVLPILARLGAGAIRDEMYWDQVESERGRHQLNERFAAWHAAAQAAGLEVLQLLTFANPLYDSGKTPHSAAGIAAFADYAGALHRLLGGKACAWEVWNEYNGSFCDGPAAEDRPRSYAALLKAAAQRLRRDDPRARIVGGAAVLQPLPWFEDLCAAGFIADLDAVAIHPYRHRPEGVEREIGELRALLARHGGTDTAIWATETGTESFAEHDWERGLGLFERSREESARYLVRQFALLRLAGCSRVFWYVAADTGSFRTMGLLRQEEDVAGTGPFAATATAVAYAVFADQVGVRPCRGREAATPYSRTWCLRFAADGAAAGEDVRVCWSTVASALELRADAPLQAVGIMGDVRTLAPVDGVVRLPTCPEAVYVRGAVRDVVAVPEARLPIAASDDDFAGRQGAGGWSYGFRRGRDGAFQAMAWTRTAWDWRWAAEGHPYLHHGRDGCEPEGDAAAPWYADRRWTAPDAGSLALTGQLGSTDAQSDGLDLHVQVDGSTVWSRTVAGGEIAELDVPLRVSAGSTVDVLVGPNRAASYDACRVDLRLVRAAP